MKRRSLAQWGSPPRTWGIQKAACKFADDSGITPTYMGNTKKVRYKEWVFEDHPHVHGEYDHHLMFARQHLGSPPRTWGIPIGSNY